MSHNAEKDAHDGQHPHPCGPCSFVRARRDDNAEKDAVSHGPDNPCEPKCHGWGIGCPCNPRSAENGLPCHRCEASHETSCCHPSRHALCDECVRERRVQVPRCTAFPLDGVCFASNPCRLHGCDGTPSRDGAGCSCNSARLIPPAVTDGDGAA